MSEESSKQSPPTEREQTDATGEFFSVGAPLHAVRAGYIKRKADDQLYDTLLSGRYAHVLAPDRSGKTSLIAATAARLEAIGCKIAVIDLQQIGVRDGGGDPGRWYYNVAYRLLRQLRIRYDLQGWWHDRSILSNRQRLVEFYSEILLRNVHERIIVFVDEIQSIEELPFADQLLASIRAAHNARATDPEFSRLTFALLGECDPLNLIDEPDLSPFNITQPVALADFTRPELDLFATELNLPPEHAAAALDRVVVDDLGVARLGEEVQLHRHRTFELLEHRRNLELQDVAIIRVDAATEVELKEKKHRVEDALSATRAAQEEGILPGGGVALYRAAQRLDDLRTEVEEERGEAGD